MSSKSRPTRWSVADRISVVVLLGAAVVIGLGWRSGAIGSVQKEPIRLMTEALATEACGMACYSPYLGLSGEPVTGMAYRR